jgi:hypothetical protein
MRQEEPDKKMQFVLVETATAERTSVKRRPSAESPMPVKQRHAVPMLREPIHPLGSLPQAAQRLWTWVAKLTECSELCTGERVH